MFWWLGINAGLMLLLQPYFMRFSRAVWLAIFVKYNPDWKSKKPDNTLNSIVAVMLFRAGTFLV